MAEGSNYTHQRPPLTLSEKKVPRYYDPYSQKVVKPRSHAAGVVTSQQVMLENLRMMRQQLEREDRALDRMQQELFHKQYPGKWTNHKHQMDDEEPY